TSHSRLHVSQNRHQIFITFAEYDANYIHYLNDDPPPAGASRPFLRMHQSNRHGASGGHSAGNRPARLCRLPESCPC
ncbi:hypothetical protein BO71DRAFT_336988, partial [Aspergillus ellipticus CBS 707.79]